MSKATELQAKRIAASLMALDGKENLQHLENVDGLSRDEMEMLENLTQSDPAAAATLSGIVAKAKRSHNGSNKPANSASVTLKITRTITKGNLVLVDSNAQVVPLPAPIFGVLEYESNFTRVLSAFLPKDGSVRVKSFAKSADGQYLIVTYNNADDSVNETVSIQGTNTVYTNLLRGMLNATFDINEPKFILGDTARINQFDQPLNIFNGSMFTQSSTDNISPQDYKTDFLSDNTVRILKDKVAMNPEKTLVPMIVAPTDQTHNGALFYFTIVSPLINIKKGGDGCGCK